MVLIYHPEPILSLIYYIITAGLGRIHQTEILQYNGTLMNLLGLSDFPINPLDREFMV